MDLSEQSQKDETLRNKKIDRSNFFKPDLYSQEMPAAMAGKQAYFDRTKKYDLRHKDEIELGNLAQFFGEEASFSPGDHFDFRNKKAKDNYYYMTSRPYGGVWEGQVPMGTFKEDPLLSRIYQHLFGR